MPQLLSDVRVIDLSDEPLAFGARLLADFGADVIRIEHMAVDALRRRGPHLDADPPSLKWERGLAHLTYNAGKRSLAVDFRDASLWSDLEPMLAHADVLIAPCEPNPELAEWLDRGRRGEWAHAVSIIDCTLRREGPPQPISDISAMAAGGHIVLNGHSEDPPIHPAGNLAYKQASIAAAEAAMALVLQGGTGRVTISMQEAIAFTALQTANGNYWPWHNHSPDRHTPIGAPTVLTSKDGHWLSFTIHPPHWPRFVEWADRAVPGGATELRKEEFDDEGWRGANYRERIRPWVERVCAELTLEELCTEGQRIGLLVMPINSPAEVAQDPHLRSRGFFQRVPHPQIGREVELPRPAVRLRGEPEHARRAPALGEHTVEILRSLAGWSDAEIKRRRERGQIGCGIDDPPAVTAQPAAAPRPARKQPPRQPLAGVRVIDFCWAIAGSLGTRLLADLGADVIKVESQARLDPIRYIGVQPPDHFSINTNGVFNDCSAGKRSCTISLNSDEGKDIIRRLVAQADVVTSNFTPFTLDHWGLGYDELKRIKPDIILLNAAVMGIEGPRAGWRSYGNGIIAMCGIAERSRIAGRVPIGTGTLHTDFTVPYILSLAIMSALHRRGRTGEGASIELAQYETAVQLLDTEITAALNGLPEEPPCGNRSPNMAPHGVFPAAGEDRWVAIACRDDADWIALCGAIGRPELAERGALSTLDGRRVHLDAIEQMLAAWTARRDRWEAAAALVAAGVPASPVERLEDFFEGPDTAMRANWARVQSGEHAVFVQQREPILWDGERLPSRRAPMWGEHTEEVLREAAGCSDEEISRLAAAGVLE